MKGYVVNIEDKTQKNEYFREVLFTTDKSQLVVMALQPGEDIGEEVHPEHDQFIRVESGQGKAVLNGEESMLDDGSAVVIPAGTKHNIINTCPNVMKLYTIYTPPEHKDGTIHKTKQEALIEHPAV
ncbi:cupin [Candidatus Roizmanbacteria bacterium RIFCSPHIGHO2_02_FULL_37_13b]|uniref:Cupin n=1 Tax=Candidatus Roizmanbacteria bacterium RIFCSPLOWO2_02_FULL_36_11 TaxID=1802071 RepID=A0A1F7JIK7_9BACT|nr:MAG: cupin [Candidatus Roizmanbacteria bacterium RIFCSPHIGHO2_02_FULL_37_13b]OGK55421.1 MAG: cupin [Candidatus Roizmanbacteria bacterium RIFCSPLOWO2_02_FULL_36_11]